MTLELLSFDRLPGYAGVLKAARHPELADRFHFWRGTSGSRYACTRYLPSRVPDYENAIFLFVRRREDGDAAVLGLSAGGKHALPFGTDEVHVHLVQGGPDAARDALADLSALVVRRPPLYVIDRRAA